MRKINKDGLALIKQWEGLRLAAYKDAAGVWTIGYGHTRAAGHPIPHAGMTISETEAESLLASDLRQYERAVQEAVHVPLHDNQFAALVSFCYNVGPGAFAQSTLCKKLNQGDYDAVPLELAKWTRAGGKKLKGLVNRRAAEAGLWVKGSFVTSRDIKPEIVKERHLCKHEAFAPLVGAVSGVGSVVSESGALQYALAFMMVVACLLGAWWFIRHVRRESI